VRSKRSVADFSTDDVVLFASIELCVISLEPRLGVPDATADFLLPITHPRLIL
jgi:hypothetical protein